MLVYYKLVVNVELVENGIPGSVELRNGVVIFQGEGVATAVTSRKIWVYTAQRVHGLMNIS